MANNLDRIVQVNIDIASPAIDRANFDNMLIFGPAPKIPPVRALPEVGFYSSLAEVTGAGFAAIGEHADPVGAAARIAFSQTPRPNHLLIATMQEAEASVENMEIGIVTDRNYHSEAFGAAPDDPLPQDLPWLQITYRRRPVSAMDVVVEKDDIVVFGKDLPLTKNANAFLQIPLGTSAVPGGDHLGLDPSAFAGTYRATLTGRARHRTTAATGMGVFDGTSDFTRGVSTKTVDPAMMSPVETLERAYGTTGWYVACAAGIDESIYEQCAEWTEAHMRQFCYTFLTEEDPVSPIFFRSHGWCGLIRDGQYPGDVPQSNLYCHVAATARGLSFPAGSETWALQRVNAVLPSDMSSTLMRILEEGHSNWIDRRAGRTVTMNGQNRAGEWIDVIRGRDWLQNDMQLRIFNLLLMRPKIPFTNPGIALVENVMIASLKAAQDRSIVAPDEYDADGNLVPGFVVRVPNAMSLTPTEKASRVLRNCTFTARIAGAIHVVVVNGTLTYEIFTDAA